jgi:hypothetical protein
MYKTHNDLNPTFITQILLKPKRIKFLIYKTLNKSKNLEIINKFKGINL